VPDGAAFAETPDAATIFGAAKLTGRTNNGWTFGILEAVTGEEAARWTDDQGQLGTMSVEPATNYLMARALKDLRGGQTQLGVLATAVNRRLEDDYLTELLRSNAFAGGVDFSHEFLRRTWSVEGFFTASQVSGSPEAMIRSQRQSSRYYHRPDASHVDVDSTMTRMRGYSARLELGKRAGLHWRGEAGLTASSPGFEWGSRPGWTESTPT
jgi:hypothetical protein